MIRFTVTALSDAALELSQALRIRATADGYFVRLERRGHDPVLITTTVNAAADRLVAAAPNPKPVRPTPLTSDPRPQRDRRTVHHSNAPVPLTPIPCPNAV